MGLVARALEEAGVTTVVLTSARDITESVNPPRALFSDLPLGHTAGRPRDPDSGLAIVGAALALVETAGAPGQIAESSVRWDADDSWKLPLLGPAGDDRRPRHPTPQYQSPADERAAAESHGGVTDEVRAGVDY